MKFLLLEQNNDTCAYHCLVNTLLYTTKSMRSNIVFANEVAITCLPARMLLEFLCIYAVWRLLFNKTKFWSFPARRTSFAYRQ